jgi:trans-2-enoyl-CoA reductase
MWTQATLRTLQTCYLARCNKRQRVSRTHLTWFPQCNSIYKFSKNYSTNNLPIEATVARYHSTGPAESVLKLEKEPLPSTLKDNEVLVKMVCAPVNPADWNMIEGVYPQRLPLPAVGGNEGVGKVVAVGSSVRHIKVDDYVIPAKLGLGTWRSHLVCDADAIDVVPYDVAKGEVKPEYFACISINPLTAYVMLREYASTMREGDVILQNGSSSMVAQCINQLATHLFGFKVVNVLRQLGRIEYDRLVERLKKNGAYIVVSDSYLLHQRMAVHKLLSDLPKPKLAFNAVGGPTVTEMIRLLDEGGRVVTYGGMSRQPVTVPTSALLFKGIKLEGFWLTRWLETHTRDERLRIIQELISLVQQNKLILYTERHPFNGLINAIHRAKQPTRDGRKVVLSFDN